MFLTLIRTIINNLAPIIFEQQSSILEMFSEESCDIEDRSNDAENSA